MDNVLTATTYLTSRDDLAAYNEEYARYFPTNKPARTTVTVASLNAPELVIEITVVAWAPELNDAVRTPRDLRTRSRSVHGDFVMFVGFNCGSACKYLTRKSLVLH